MRGSGDVALSMTNLRVGQANVPGFPGVSSGANVRLPPVADIGARCHQSPVRSRVHLVLMVAGSLSACATNTAVAVNSAPGSLVGAWVPAGAECAGDAGVIYRPDGTWGAYGVSGSWNLRGDRLTTIITKRGEPDAPEHFVSPPERYSSVILRLLQRELVERRSDGTVHAYMRCD
jgi:hypothetical protein